MAKTGAMKLMVSFVERGQGNDLAKFYAEHNVNFNYRSVGVGTASSDLLDVLGIGSAEKDVIFSLASKVNAERLMTRLTDSLRSIREKGIVFTMPLTGLNNVVATVLERQGDAENKGGNGMKKLALATMLTAMLFLLSGCFIQPDPMLDPLVITEGTIPFGTVQPLPTNTLWQ